MVPAVPPAGAPSTAWDPPTWTPAPADDPHTGSAVGVSSSGGYDQPRWMLLRFVRAVRDADGATLRRLLDDPVFSASVRQQPRSWWIDRLTRNRRRQGLSHDIPLEDLVAVRRVEVRRVDAVGEPPAGIEGSDLVLTFPLEPAGRRWLGPLLLWHDRGQLVVRSGPNPKILGF